MKPRVPDPRGRHVRLDYADIDVDQDDPFTEEFEFNAPKMVGYCPAPDLLGGYELKTQWEGFGRKHDSRDPAAAFVPRYPQCFVYFLKGHKID